jgi:hypothetical protein
VRLELDLLEHVLSRVLQAPRSSCSHSLTKSLDTTRSSAARSMVRMRLSLDFSLSSSPPLMALGSEVDPNSCCCCSEREIVQVVPVLQCAVWLFAIPGSGGLETGERLPLHPWKGRRADPVARRRGNAAAFTRRRRKLLLTFLNRMEKETLLS